MRYQSICNHNQTSVSHIITRSFDPFNCSATILCTANLHSHFFYCKCIRVMPKRRYFIYLLSCSKLLCSSSYRNQPAPTTVCVTHGRTQTISLLQSLSQTLLNRSNDPTQPGNCFINILTSTLCSLKTTDVKLNCKFL